MKIVNYLKPVILMACMVISIISCTNEKTDRPAGSSNQPSEITKVSHPAQTKPVKQENKHIKIDARGGTVGDQIKQQQIQDERQKRAQHLNVGGMKWTTFDKIARSGKNEGNKKYLVDVYTEWCGWCKVMDKKTFTDPEIKKYLEENFHIVKFDAEQKEMVKFKDKEYNWVNGGRKGINQLAIELLGNRMSYPTLVYLDENLNKITASPGYKKPDQLIRELKAITKK